MGSCIRLRNSILTSCSFFSIRFLIVLRPITNEPHLRDRVQKCVKPRKSNGSGLSPCSSRCLAAWRPKRISRVFADIVKLRVKNQSIERESETAEDRESLAKRLIAEQPGRCRIGRIEE